MTEKEKMLAGELYDCGDPEILKMWNDGKNLMRKYNSLDYSDKEGQREVLHELLGSHGKNTQITAPFFVDFGKLIFIGNNSEINMNCVFLDCNRITIGDNVLIAPGVHIYTVYHPIGAKDRNNRNLNNGNNADADETFSYAVSQTSPVTIGNSVWIGGGSIILPGVTIGDNVTIGAGSIVTKSIRSNVLAYGNPCRVIKEIAY